jgi:hypothetical protein
MKTFTVNKNSWHYQIYKFDNDFDTHSSCTYVNRILISLLWIITIIFLSAGFFTPIVLAIAGTIAMIQTGVNVIDPPLVLCYLYVIGIILAFLITYSISLYAKHKHKHKYTKKEKCSPGFISLAYSSLKDKICVRIEFTD